MTIDHKTKNIISDYFSQKPQVVSVYLYGSQARGQAKADSDIDLAILVINRRKDTLGMLEVFSYDLHKLINKKVEIQDLESVPVDFAHRVLAEGKLLLANDQRARIAFEEEIIRNYFDLKPALEEYYQSLSEIAQKGELHVRYI